MIPTEALGVLVNTDDTAALRLPEGALPLDRLADM
jgi:hypothetical protein